MTEVLPEPAAATTRTLLSRVITAWTCSSVSGLFSTRSKNGRRLVTSLARMRELMDLSRPDNALLQMLLREAPGTYQHSSYNFV